MAVSPEAANDLRRAWSAAGPAGRAVITLGSGVLALLLLSSAAGAVKGALAPRAPATAAPAATPPAASATPEDAAAEGPPALAFEKSAPDPAGRLRSIAAGDVPTLQIGYRWIGVLKEQSIGGFEGPPGWTAHFTWSRRPWSGANIDVFETQAQAAAALGQIMGGTASLLLISNPDGRTHYAATDVTAPGGATYDMRCALRLQTFRCSAIPEGVPAIVTVTMQIDSRDGLPPSEVDAKVAEIKADMGKETDEVMRSLAAQGLDGTRAVAR